MFRPLVTPVLLASLIAGCAAPSTPSISSAAVSATTATTAVSPSAVAAATSSSPPRRETASPASTPSATFLEPSSGPSVPPWTVDADVLAWHRLGKISGSVDAVIGFARGYVALDGSDGAVLVSTDGRSWRKVRLPFDPPETTRDPLDANGTLGLGLATNGTDVLIVGGYSHEPCQLTEPGSTGEGPDCDYSPVAWISGDGVTWRVAYPDTGTGEFVAAWPVATGGWDAALSTWGGEVSTGQDLWHSADGLTWTRLNPAPPAAWSIPPVAATDATGRRVLAACLCDNLIKTTVSTSPDGRVWTVSKGFPGRAVTVLAGVAPAHGTSRWVMAGSTMTDDITSVPTVWSSKDLVHWKATRLAVHPGVAAGSETGTVVGEVDALVVTERGYVAVGTAFGQLETTDTAAHETWVSDKGVTWTALKGTGRPVLDYGPGLLADGPAGVIGVSATGVEGEWAAWQLR
jgi:hypothetical protein